MRTGATETGRPARPPLTRSLTELSETYHETLSAIPSMTCHIQLKVPQS